METFSYDCENFVVAEFILLPIKTIFHFQYVLSLTFQEDQSAGVKSSDLWHIRDEFPMIDRGGYILHPRNPSLLHDLSDPVLVHVNTAEAMLHRGKRNNYADLPKIHNLIEFNYIENKTLEKQFLVSIFQRQAGL